jgi:DNA-binding transcriptional LysR family regulator
MELEARLRAFAAFARRRSFSAAARELRISQPAVSKHIADMERAVGVRLVVRRSRGGELTPAGEFLANHVLRAHALLVQASRGIGGFGQRITRTLTIVASGVPATYLLPEVVVAFQRAHPGARVIIVPGSSAQTMDALRSHRAELGVVGGFAAAPEVEAEPLVEERIVVVGAPRPGRRWMSRGDAEAATWISPYEGSVGHPTCGRGGLGRHRYHPQSPPRVTKLGICETGRGSRPWRGESELRAGTLGLIRLRGWKVRRMISIVRHREAALTPLAREFVAMLHARWHRLSQDDRDEVVRDLVCLVHQRILCHKRKGLGTNPDFTQELSRKSLPKRAKEPQSRRHQNR